MLFRDPNNENKVMLTLEKKVFDYENQETFYRIENIRWVSNELLNIWSGQCSNVLSVILTALQTALYGADHLCIYHYNNIDLLHSSYSIMIKSSQVLAIDYLNSIFLSLQVIRSKKILPVAQLI